MSENASHETLPEAETAGSPQPLIVIEISRFTQHIDALSNTLPLLMTLMDLHITGMHMKFNDFLETRCEKSEEVEGVAQYKIPPIDFREYMGLQRRCTHAEVGSVVLPRSYLVALVSQFDFFLGRLIRALFLMQPERLNSSEKQMTFGQLLKFRSMEEAREYVLEKEVETVLRMSHSDQFAWLENKFGVKLRKDLDIWPDFIEITERRNLFVHTDGVVSSQYRAVCREAGLPESTLPKAGHRLFVDHSYFSISHSILYELGVKLAHVLWRVVDPSDREEADSNLNDLVYELVHLEDYEMAEKLGKFAIKYIFRKDSKDRTIKMTVINIAQALKWAGKDEEAKKLVAEYDWSSSGDQFQIALMMLSDDYVSAKQIMLRMGREGVVKESAYQDWPIFKEFRKSHEFLESYQDIFGKPFAPVQAAPSPPQSASEVTNTDPRLAEQQADQGAEESKLEIDLSDENI